MVSGLSNNNNHNIGCQPLKNNVKFKGKKEKSEYENPVSRPMEKALAVGGAGALTAGLGGIVYFAARHMGSKNAGIIGGVAGLIAAVATIPSALYRAGVSSFTRKKEMDVFSREKSVETGLTEGIDKDIKEGEKPLEDNIKNFQNYSIGKNGRGMAVINTNA